MPVPAYKCCPVCETTFSKPANVSLYSWGRRECCSPSCASKLQHQRKREARRKPCERCGELFVGRPAQRFCSKRCGNRRGHKALPLCKCGCGEQVGDHRSAFKKGHAFSTSLFDRAHHAVKTALRNGTLVKPDSCEDCGTGEKRLSGHHESYAEEDWLVVEWLCTKCHATRHAGHWGGTQSSSLLAKITPARPRHSCAGQSAPTASTSPTGCSRGNVPGSSG